MKVSACRWFSASPLKRGNSCLSVSSTYKPSNSPQTIFKKINLSIVSYENIPTFDL